jgi:hypothetical protein
MGNGTICCADISVNGAFLALCSRIHRASVGQVDPAYNVARPQAACVKSIQAAVLTLRCSGKTSSPGSNGGTSLLFSRL